MKTLTRLLIALSLGLSPVAAMADGCSTQTITYNGKMMTCTTCCYFGHCNTNCY